MALEELDDIAEDLADKLGIYGEERSHWTSEFKQRIREEAGAPRMTRDTRGSCMNEIYQRPSIDQYFMDMVKLVSTRGTCRRRLVGCIITDAYGHILSTGYNGVPQGMPHCLEHPCPGATDKSGNTTRCLAVHAEQNALLQCSNLERAHKMYCTTAPCLMCARMILNTPIEFILVGETYTDVEGYNLLMRSSRTFLKWNYAKLEAEHFSY